MKTMSKPEPKFIPKKLYAESTKYDQLAGKLRANGSDVSKWFRRKIEEELSKK